MKKMFAILLVFAMLASFAACTKTTITIEPTTEPDLPASETADEIKDVLSFISKDEIYFDIHLTEGLFDKTSVKVGDQVLTTSGKAAYTGNEEIVFEGKSDSDKDVYLVIISLKAGEKATSDYSIVEASDLAEMLAKRIPIHKNGKDKILVVVTDTKDGYDHNLDDALGDMIKLALK